MSALLTISGSKIYTCGPVASKTLVAVADFIGPWTEIGGWAQSGAIAPTQAVTEQALISSGYTDKAKGVKNSGSMENTFKPLADDPGQAILKAAEDDCRRYGFKVEWSAGCALLLGVTISSATPAVVTAAGHGLVAGQAVVFGTSGALPTGLTAGTTYYVLPTGLTANAFTVSLTAGGAAVATTAAGSGSHTVAAQPSGMTNFFQALVLPKTRQGGDASAVQLVGWSLAICANVVEV